jgi:hypothetical protein
MSTHSKKVIFYDENFDGLVSEIHKDNPYEKGCCVLCSECIFNTHSEETKKNICKKIEDNLEMAPSVLNYHQTRMQLTTLQRARNEYSELFNRFDDDKHFFVDELQNNLEILEKITSRIQQDLTNLDTMAVEIRKGRKYKKFCRNLESLNKKHNKNV